MALKKMSMGIEIECTPAEEEAIRAQWANEEAKSALTRYVRGRVALYPPVQDQLDMMYKDMMNGTSFWKDLITSIKNQFPKPL